jgi:hypothetical protein
MLRRFLASHGIRTDPPSAAFFNEPNGMLMYRGAIRALDQLGKLLDQLDVAAQIRTEPRAGTVSIEVQILEIPESPARRKTWFSPAPRSSGLLASLFADLPTQDAPVRNVTPAGLLPGAGSSNAANYRIDLSRLDGQAVALTAPQVDRLNRELDALPGFTRLASQGVTTVSERQARIQILERRTIVSGVDALDETPDRQASINYPSEGVDLGPSIDLLPIAADGSWRLQLTASHTEFLGYDDPGGFVVEARSNDPKTAPIRGQKPLPRFRVRETTGDHRIRPGEVMLLRGPLGERQVRHAGTWFRKPRTETQRQRLYYLVSLRPEP